MPFEFLRMKWCLEHRWKPHEFDEMDALTFNRWQLMMQQEADVTRGIEQMEESRAESRARREGVQR